MIIAHNMAAMNGNRVLGINNQKKALSAEKLASGYRINRAADDAAGLAISEKMRAQIRGLDQATKNIEDAISFLQVADGAMNEINDMLVRLTELSVQAANDTYVSSDREAIEREVEAIKKEIDAINDNTQFNTKPVFFEKGTVIQNVKPTTDSNFFKLMAGNVTTSGYMNEEILSADLQSLNHTAAHSISGGQSFTGVHIDFGALLSSGKCQTLSGEQFYVNCCTDCCPTVVQFDDSISVTVSDKTPAENIKQIITIGLKKNDGTYYTDAAVFSDYVVNGLKDAMLEGHVQFASDGTNLLIYDIDPNKWSVQDKKLAYFCDTSNFYDPGTMVLEGLNIQMSGQAGDGMVVRTGIVNTKALGIAEIKVNPREEAEKSIEKVRSAITTAVRIRSRIGAQQNRLEHAARINENSAENIQFAESRIRDIDMAEEMVKNSNLSILQQTSQAMISHANKSTQSVLELLK